MYFTITTNREVADQIIRQCNYDERFGNKSYKLGKIVHTSGYSDIQIVPKKERIELSDIFWLGLFSVSQ